MSMKLTSTGDLSVALRMGGPGDENSYQHDLTSTSDHGSLQCNSRLSFAIIPCCAPVDLSLCLSLASEWVP